MCKPWSESARWSSPDSRHVCRRRAHRRKELDEARFMVPDDLCDSEARPRSRRNSEAALRIFTDTLRLSGWIRSRGDAMTCVEIAACARIDGCAWLGRDHAGYIEIATALEDSLAYNINISSSFLYTY